MDCPLYIYNYSKMHTVEYPASRGPLCFTCEEVTDPTLCHRVVVCAPDQVSSIILISENLAGSIHDATIIATYAIFFFFSTGLSHPRKYRVWRYFLHYKLYK